jgi:hypothetical protein
MPFCGAINMLDGMSIGSTPSDVDANSSDH